MNNFPQCEAKRVLEGIIARYKESSTYLIKLLGYNSMGKLIAYRECYIFFYRINARQYQKTASAGMGMGAGGNMSGMPGQ